MTAEGRVPAEHLRLLRAADRRAAVTAAERRSAERRAAAAAAELLEAETADVAAVAALHQAVLAAVGAGGSVRTIATAIGRSPTTVQAWIKEATP